MAPKGPRTPKKEPELTAIGELKKLMELMKKQIEFDAWFGAPVVTKNLPGYTTVITNPQDLGTIRKRLNKGHYANDLSLAIADIRTVFDNARRYSPDVNEPVHIAANKLSKFFESAVPPVLALIESAAAAGTAGGAAAGGGGGSTTSSPATVSPAPATAAAASTPSPAAPSATAPTATSAPSAIKLEAKAASTAATTAVKSESKVATAASTAAAPATATATANSAAPDAPSVKLESTPVKPAAAAAAASAVPHSTPPAAAPSTANGSVTPNAGVAASPAAAVTASPAVSTELTAEEKKARDNFCNIGFMLAPGWLSKFEREVYLLRESKEAEVFKLPVDWFRLNILDYPHIVPNPMDLGTVLQRLATNSSNQYQSVGEAVRDMDLIWQNCFAYNKPGSGKVRRDGEKMHQKWNKVLQQMIQQNEKALAKQPTRSPAAPAATATAAPASLQLGAAASPATAAATSVKPRGSTITPSTAAIAKPNSTTASAFTKTGTTPAAGSAAGAATKTTPPKAAAPKADGFFSKQKSEIGCLAAILSTLDANPRFSAAYGTSLSALKAKVLRTPATPAAAAAAATTLADDMKQLLLSKPLESTLAPAAEAALRKEADAKFTSLFTLFQSQLKAGTLPFSNAGAAAAPNAAPATTVAVAGAPATTAKKQRTGATGPVAVPAAPDVKLCLELLQKLRKLPGADVFAKPVDPIRDRIPHYAEKIKQPMDFSTVEMKINTGKYQTDDAFKFDMDLIWSNCVLFNGAESEYGLIAIKMSTKFESIYSTYLKAKKARAVAAATATAPAAAVSSNAAASSSAPTASAPAVTSTPPRQPATKKLKPNPPPAAAAAAVPAGDMSASAAAAAAVAPAATAAQPRTVSVPSPLTIPASTKPAPITTHVTTASTPATPAAAASSTASAMESEEFVDITTPATPLVGTKSIAAAAAAAAAAPPTTPAATAKTPQLKIKFAAPAPPAAAAVSEPAVAVKAEVDKQQLKKRKRDESVAGAASGPKLVVVDSAAKVEPKPAAAAAAYQIVDIVAPSAVVATSAVDAAALPMPAMVDIDSLSGLPLPALPLPMPLAADNSKAIKMMPTAASAKAINALTEKKNAALAVAAATAAAAAAAAKQAATAPASPPPARADSPEQRETKPLTGRQRVAVIGRARSLTAGIDLASKLLVQRLAPAAASTSSAPTAAVASDDVEMDAVPISKASISSALTGLTWRHPQSQQPRRAVTAAPSAVTRAFGSIDSKFNEMRSPPPFGGKPVTPPPPAPSDVLAVAGAATSAISIPFPVRDVPAVARSLIAQYSEHGFVKHSVTPSGDEVWFRSTHTVLSLPGNGEWQSLLPDMQRTVIVFVSTSTSGAPATAAFTQAAARLDISPIAVSRYEALRSLEPVLARCRSNVSTDRGGGLSSTAASAVTAIATESGESSETGSQELFECDDWERFLMPDPHAVSTAATTTTTTEFSASTAVNTRLNQNWCWHPAGFFITRLQQTTALPAVGFEIVSVAGGVSLHR